MPRRIRRILLALAILVVGGLAAGFAVFARRGSDAPPPPRLSEATPEASATAAPAGRATWEVVSGGRTFVGYRVREEFVTVGVVTPSGAPGR